MNRRLEDGAKKYQQITRLINQHALAEGVRAETMARLNRSFEDFNRTASKVNASNKEIRVSTRLYNDQIDKLKDGIATVARLETQRVAAARKNAKELETIEKKRVADSIALQSRLQQAQGAVQGITLRAGRQLSPEAAAGITRQAEVALARYTTALNTYGVRSLEAGRAAGAFGMPQVLVSLGNF